MLTCMNILIVTLQQFGAILDVEIIFNERGSKVSFMLYSYTLSYLFHNGINSHLMLPQCLYSI